MDIEDNKFGQDIPGSPFRLPDNYFEDFALKMDSAIKAEQKNSQPQAAAVRFRQLVITVLSSAAVFAGLIIGGYALLSMQHDVEQKADQIIAQETYIDEMMDMVDLDYVENVLADSEFMYVE